MKSSKHTPGPWSILKGHTGRTWFVIFKTRETRQRTEAAHVYKKPTLVSSNGVEATALVSVDSQALNYSANNDQNMVEAQANAHLISAAPELLNALEKAYLQILEFLNEGNFKREVVFDAGYIVEAIAKAKGEK